MSDYEIRDARFEGVVELSGVERVSTGFGFTEGPVWDHRNQSLIFSDMLQDHQRRWSARNGIETFRQPSNKTNGSAFDRQGRLVCCEHLTSRVVRIDAKGRSTILASHYNGKELNSPNDVVVRSDGSIWFTDPIYGRFHEDIGLLRNVEQAHRGVYRIDPNAGTLSVVADDFWQPNGLCFSTDESRLFIADTPRLHVRVFDVTKEGRLSGGTVWAETLDELGRKPNGSFPTHRGMKPDGMKVDSQDHLFVVGPGGVHVFDADATCLGVVRLSEHTTNFAFGGEDFQSLYITAGGSLYRIRLKVPGFALF